MNLKDKKILLGVTGGIAAYKACAVASGLVQMGADVDVVMTRNATRLVCPALFEGLTHRKCHTDTFEQTDDLLSSHVTLGSKADLAVIAPCTANMLAKIAPGIADNKLSTTMLAVRCPVVLVPAMNCFMYENVATQANIALLRARGFHVLEPDTGNLACGYAAKGRMPDPEDIIEIIRGYLAMPHCLAGKKVVVTAGATREAIDDVRCITNHSTGKMGYACARAAVMAGANVVLVSAPTSLRPVIGACTVQVRSAADMAAAVFREAEDADVVIMAAAVSDFTPASPEKGKIHKDEAGMNIELSRTADILKTLGSRKRPGQFLCGFCMETRDLIPRARHKLEAKRADMIVANDLGAPGCGFAGDTNGVTILTTDREVTLDVADKLDIAAEIIRMIAQEMQ